MSTPMEAVERDLFGWAESRGIKVSLRRLAAGKAGEFNGVSATVNSDYAVDERCWYFAHALGSIVRWSLSRDAIQAMFNELRDARKQRDADPARLEKAIEQYRAFEIEASELAVWLFGELGHMEVIGAYTTFMRADLEALTIFHRTGKAPVWRDFFADWKRGVADGRIEVVPFRSKPIPAFVPVRIENQEILQRQPGEKPKE
jgi:hypothetical protein